MGVSNKNHLRLEDGGLLFVSDCFRNWDDDDDDIPGVSVRTHLRPVAINTNRRFRLQGPDDDYYSAAAWGEETGEEEEECCTTPTAREARLVPPEKMTCPPAPRKPRSKPSACHSLLFGGPARRREFFRPPDLESVFVRRAF